MRPEKIAKLFLLVWSIGTLTVDGIIGWGIFWQMQAERWPTARGVITESKVVTSQGDGSSTSYTANLRYTYTVAGVRYTGNRLDFWGDDGSDYTARQIVESHPIGREVVVYHHPDRPANSVLQPGILGKQRFFLLFLTPFNVMMLCGWAVGLWSLVQRRSDSWPVGWKVWDDGLTARIRLPVMHPFAAAILPLVIIPFVALFVGPLFVFGTDPTWQQVQLVWMLAIGGTVLVFVLAWLRLLSGVTDVVVDRQASTLLVRRRGLTIPLDQVKAVEIEPNAGNPSMVEVQLALAGDDKHPEKLHASYVRARDGERLAQWLREAMGR